MKQKVKNTVLLIGTVFIVGIILFDIATRETNRVQNESPKSDISSTSQTGQATNERDVERVPISTAPVPTIFENKAPTKRVVTEETFSQAREIDDNTLLFASDPDYEIIYFDETDSFLISITSSPFEEIKTRAEDTFVETLKITEEEACTLKVRIATPQFANPDQAGKSFPLSFCE